MPPLKPGEIASYFKEVSATEWTFPDGKPRKVSVRSLERYKQKYEQGGLEALKPALVPNGDQAPGGMSLKHSRQSR